VTNTGDDPVTNAVPDAPTSTGSGAVGTPIGPSPVSIATLAPGAAGTFTWTYQATGAGTLAFAGGARAEGGTSGTAVTAATDPARPAALTLQLPAVLTASLPASGGAAFGQEFTVTMTVANTGGAEARNLVPSAPTVAPAGLAALKPGTGASPASVASLAAGATTQFTWTFVAGFTPAEARFTAGVSGTDANSGAPVTSGSATSGAFVIGVAGVNATLSAGSPTVVAGRVATLTLTVTNPGLVELRGFTVGAPVASSPDGASATLTGGPSPPPPAVVGAGQTVTVAWTFDPALAAGTLAGHLAFDATASGVDAFSGGAVTARAAATVTVQAPAAVTATALTTTPGTLGTGRPFAATLTLARSGSGSVSVTGVSLTGTACTTPPVTPEDLAGSTLALTWTGCTAPPTPQTLRLTGSATWVDAGAPLVPRTTDPIAADVIVLAPATAGLVVTFTAQPPSPVKVGQVIPFSASVRNDAPAGGPGVIGVAVTPSVTSVSGRAAARCTAATPVSATIAAASAVSFVFTCTPSRAGTLTFTASASGRAEDTGAALSASVTTAPATTVQR
jgi:hypothetical protein